MSTPTPKPKPKLNLPEGFWQATFRFAGASLPRGAAIVFGGQVPPTGTPTPASVGDGLKVSWIGTGKPYSTSGGFNIATSLVDILVKFGPLEDGPAAVTAVNQTLGVGGGDPVPPNCTMLIQKLTALGGHVGRGRIFHPGISESEVGPGGVIINTILASYQTSFNAALTSMDSTGIPMHLLHTYYPDKGETPRAPTKVITLRCAAVMATQRHRLRA